MPDLCENDFSVGCHEERHAISWLEPVADGLHVEGKIRLTADGDRYEIAVCVWGAMIFLYGGLVFLGNM